MATRKVCGRFALPWFITKGSGRDKLTTVPDELRTLFRQAEIPLDDNGRRYTTVFDTVTQVTSGGTSAYVTGLPRRRLPSS